MIMRFIYALAIALAICGGAVLMGHLFATNPPMALNIIVSIGFTAFVIFIYQILNHIKK